MNYLDAVILGVLEGLTEFLPVSSTGHLILGSHLLGIPGSAFLSSFTIAIQLGSVLAVVVWNWRLLVDLDVLKRLVVAFIPTGIVGFLLYRVVKDLFLGNTLIVIWALALGGCLIILIEHGRKNREEPERDIRTMTYWESFLIGLYQALAIVPGVSRSGATVMGGLLMGLPRATILSFSFLLAVPTMLMATLYDIYKTPEVFVGANPSLLLTGFGVAFLVALVVLRYALSFVKQYSFAPFGWYRIVLALLFAAFFL